MSHLKLQAAAATHPGQVRESNQDAVLALVAPAGVSDILGLLVVADGMGGHQAGEVASSIAIESIERSLSDLVKLGPPAGDGDIDTLRKRLVRAIEIANHAIIQYGKENPDTAGNLGSTVTCALVLADKALIANVGDSRAYHFVAGDLRQVTEDHSYIGELVREGQLPPEALYTHPLRSMITRALGQQPLVDVDVTVSSLASGDRLVLCSDGLWEMVPDTDELIDCLGDGVDPTVSVALLIDVANKNGGADNIGVAVGQLI